MTTNGLTKALEGEHWRGLTPLLLGILIFSFGLTQALSFWILNDVRDSVKNNTSIVMKVVERLGNHESNSEFHGSIVKDVNWLQKTCCQKI